MPAPSQTSNPSHSNLQPSFPTPHPSASAQGHQPVPGPSTFIAPSQHHPGPHASTSSASSIQVPVRARKGESPKVQRREEHNARKAGRRKAWLAAGYSERDVDAWEEVRARNARESKGHPVEAPQQRIAPPTDVSGSQGPLLAIWPTVTWSLLKLTTSEMRFVGTLAQMRVKGGLEVEMSVTPRTLAALQTIEPTLGTRRDSDQTGKSNEQAWRELAFNEWCQWCAARGISAFPIVGSLVACFLRDTLASNVPLPLSKASQELTRWDHRHRQAFIYILELYRRVTYPIFASLLFSKPPFWRLFETEAWLYVTTHGSKPLLAWRSIQEIESPPHSSSAQPDPPPIIPTVLRPVPPHPQSAALAGPPPITFHPFQRIKPRVWTRFDPIPPTQMSAKPQGKRREVDPVFGKDTNEHPSKRPRQDSTPSVLVSSANDSEGLAFGRAIHGLGQAMMELANLRGIVFGQGVGTGGVGTSQEQTSSSREVSGSKQGEVPRLHGAGGSHTRDVSNDSALATVLTRALPPSIPFTAGRAGYDYPPSQSYSLTIASFVSPSYRPFSMRPVLTARPLHHPTLSSPPQLPPRLQTNEGKAAAPVSLWETMYQFSPHAQARPPPPRASLPNPPRPLSSGPSLDEAQVTTTTTTSAGSTSTSNVNYSTGTVVPSSTSFVSIPSNPGSRKPILPPASKTLQLASPLLQNLIPNFSPSLSSRSSTPRSAHPTTLTFANASKKPPPLEERVAGVAEVKIGSIVTSLASPPPDVPAPVGHHQPE